MRGARVWIRPGSRNPTLQDDFSGSWYGMGWKVDEIPSRIHGQVQVMKLWTVQPSVARRLESANRGDLDPDASQSIARSTVHTILLTHCYLT